jgi:hypothetical protein
LTVPGDRSVLADKEQGARAPPPAPTAGNGQQSRLRSNPSGAVSAVRLQLADECDAMARHALGSGLTVPAWVLDVVERSRVSQDSERSDAGRSFQSADPYESGEWDVMSLASGPPARLDELGRAHSALARMIRPATPRGILLLNRGRQHGRLRWLGPVRLIRQMLVVVIVMLAAFVVLALSPDIHSTSGDIFNDSGTALLVNELFYLTAGGLGAAFYALFTAYQYIAAGTYDTTYESSYWIRYILGLIAGVVLPSLIPVSSGNSSAAVTRPLLALLGGFSAAVLYRILQRFVEIVEALAEGDSKRTEQARNEALTARGVAQMGDERLALVGELVHLRDELDAGQPVEQARASVEKLLAGVAPHGTLSDSFGPTPGGDR